MTSCLITLRSPTYALKAQAILKSSGINVSPVKLGAEFSNEGCSHGIRFDCRLKTSVTRLLSDRGIPFYQVKKNDIS